MADTGTLTTTPPDNVDRFNRPVQKWTLAWTSDASGNVTKNTGHKMNGTICGIVSVPSGTAAPTNLWDLVVNVNGIDILNGTGANLLTATNQWLYPNGSFTLSATAYPFNINIFDDPQIVITNAGNAKSGTLYFYVR